MHNKDKSRQRSVAIQSTDLSNANDETVTAKLCKKTGFRNLLQKSVTVVPQEDERKTFADGKVSRSVQAVPDANPAAVESCSRSGNGISQSAASRRPEADGGSENPGTSGMTPAAYSAFSVLSQKNEVYRRPQEGSLAMVYNYNDKTLPDTRSSNLFYYGSQGSRRFSDETVLLIEDYQSYDYANVAGRQESESVNQEKKRVRTCCGKWRRRSTNLSIRPTPVVLEDIREEDESMVCRICHEGENVEPLLQPCLCKGSVGCVHGHCLKMWLEQSNTSRCELCNYPYAIRQHKKYSKGVSVRVFFRKIIDRRTLIYDAISFVVITPLAFVGVAMCIQASVFGGEVGDTDSSIQIGNITRAGMIMLSGTIVVAYGVWLYTLISYHYKAWKKWYTNCFDVEVLPVRMTSQEKIEAAQMINQEISRRQSLSREQGFDANPLLVHSPHSMSYSFYHRRLSVNDSNR